jgi:predicted transcriptional regulator
MPRLKKNHRKPTDAELLILDVIWENGPSTVRQVFQILSEKQDMGYTTVLKFMQIMTEKGLLERDTSVRPQLFTPTQPQQQTQKALLRDLLDRAFRGSPGTLALQALSMRKSTSEELQEIRTLIDKIEREGVA